MVLFFFTVSSATVPAADVYKNHCYPGIDARKPSVCLANASSGKYMYYGMSAYTHLIHFSSKCLFPLCSRVFRSRVGYDYNIIGGRLCIRVRMCVRVRLCERCTQDTILIIFSMCVD